VRAILWPKEPPKDGASVRAALEKRIEEALAAAPRRGKGARRRRFLRHVRAVTARYGKGLYRCYDDPRIPQTTNALEGKHGVGKHHVRKALGRASTTGGPVETAGEFFVGAIDLVRRHGARALFSDLDVSDHRRYLAARRELARLREPARRYRSIQRDHEAHLQAALTRWRSRSGEGC
jgi:hypothetical protein